MYHAHGCQYDKNDKGHDDQHPHLQHIHSHPPLLYYTYHTIDYPVRRRTSLVPHRQTNANKNGAAPKDSPVFICSTITYSLILRGRHPY